MEIWKDVKGYEGLYEVSNLGNIKSFKFGKEKLLKPTMGCNGYLVVNLCIKGIKKTRTIHQIVAESFLGHINCGMLLVIDHINCIKYDNRVENLDIVSNRNNIIKSIDKSKKSSKYTGVSWCKRNKKWKAFIKINSKSKNLGSYNSELDAHNSYIYALNNIL